jgi:hypothetical protein
MHDREQIEQITIIVGPVARLCLAHVRPNCGRITRVPDARDGYEEVASLGEGAEGRILRAVIGQAVRKVATSDWSEPLEQLLAWLEAGPSRRFGDWLP